MGFPLVGRVKDADVFCFKVLKYVSGRRLRMIHGRSRIYRRPYTEEGNLDLLAYHLIPTLFVTALYLTVMIADTPLWFAA